MERVYSLHHRVSTLRKATNSKIKYIQQQSYHVDEGGAIKCLNEFIRIVGWAIIFAHIKITQYMYITYSIPGHL